MIEPLAPPSPTLPPGPLVPEERPPPEFTPARAFRIHWLLAIPAAPLVYFFPRRIGPSLAASSWLSAYAAHVFGVLLAMGFLMGQVIGIRDSRNPALVGSLSPLDELRRAAAATVGILQGFAGEAVHNPAEAVAGTIGVILGHGAIWLAAVAFLPFFSAGERRGALYLRTVKLLLWSTLLLIPFGILAPRVIVVLQERDMPFTAFALFLLWALWSLSVIARLGGRYGGPREGPRWEPAPILCERCGYALTNQPLDGRCPECAAAVFGSLPDCRVAPEIASARSIDPLPAFFRTWLQAAFRREFASRIHVWSGERRARWFAVGVATMVGLIVAAGGVLLAMQLWRQGFMEMPGRDLETKFWELAASGVIAFVIGFATVPAWMMFVGVFACRAGFAESLRRGIVICYASAIAPVIAACGVFGTLTTNWVFTWYRPRPSGVYIPEFGTIDKGVIVGCILHAPVAIGLFLSFLRARRMLRDTRYANA